MERVVVELRYRGELLSPGGVAKCPTSNFQLPPTRLQSCIQSCQVESPRQRPTSHVQRPTSNFLQHYFKASSKLPLEHRNGTSERSIGTERRKENIGAATAHSVPHSRFVTQSVD